MNSARVRLPGHPDAVCDLVAEAIVDEYTRRDPATRIAVNVMGGRGALFVAGDVCSTADFDVSQVISRTLGSLGVLSEHEPFIAIEPVAAERASVFGNGVESPVTVTGYATQETVEMVPHAVSLARRIAKALENKRHSDERWFWLGADGEVFVRATDKDAAVSIRVEHGSCALAEVRAAIEELARSIDPKLTIRINEFGADEARGLENVMGASGRETAPYGYALPACPMFLGKDIVQFEKAGSWLARAAARDLVSRGARAALVTSLYAPGDRVPTVIRARDERGKDLHRDIRPESLSLDRVRSDWWRPNLCVDAARWGFAGEAGMPWEEA